MALLYYNSYYHQNDPAQGVVSFLGTHCTVKNSTIRFANVFGVEFNGTASQYNTLENCDVQYSRGAGVDLRLGASHNVVRNCEISNNGIGYAKNEDYFDRSGIMTLGDVNTPVTYTTIEGNVIHDNLNTLTRTNNGQILLDGCQYWTIRNNYIYNSTRRAIATSDNDGTQASRNHHLDIQYNVIANWDTMHDIFFYNSAIDMSATLNDSNSGYDTIENNVLYSNYNYPMIGINLGTSSTSYYFKNTTIANNIIYFPNNTQTDSIGIRVNRDNVPNMVINNNIVYGPKNLYELFGVSLSSPSDCNKMVTSFCANDKNVNPLFTNASGNFSKDTDFQLASNSPAINAGANVGLTTDYAGNPIQGNPDIGAYEYTSVTTPPPAAVTGDLNGDSAVNATDFSIIKNDFLKLAANLTNPKSDIDADGQVTIKDVGILMSGWK